MHLSPRVHFKSESPSRWSSICCQNGNISHFCSVSMCWRCHVRRLCQRAALLLSSVKSRWNPGDMQSMKKMLWTARRTTILLGRSVSHGHASERHPAAPQSKNAPDFAKETTELPWNLFPMFPSTMRTVRRSQKTNVGDVVRMPASW